MSNRGLAERAARHAALAEPLRLAIVDLLAESDRTAAEMRVVLDIESNLLAHHLDVLESVGLVVRSRSSGDGRRRYVHLVPSGLAGLVPAIRRGAEPALFVCTRNSARSQLAAALWRRLTGERAESAGTHPADRVHPGAVAAARRARVALGAATPKLISEVVDPPVLLITVCDQAHEELAGPFERLHWSLPDPVADGSAAAFDATVAELRTRIGAFMSEDRS